MHLTDKNVRTNWYDDSMDKHKVMYPNSPWRAYLYDAGSGLHTKGNNEKLKYIQSSTRFLRS